MSGSEGSTIGLAHCDITSPVQLADLTFQWRKDGEIIDLSKNIETTGTVKYYVAHTGYLYINNTAVSDSGTYEVDISNEWGSALHIIQLNVIAVDPVKTHSPMGRLVFI